MKPIIWTEKVERRIESIHVKVEDEDDLDPRDMLVNEDKHLLETYGDQWVYVRVFSYTYPHKEFADCLGGISFFLYGQQNQYDREYLEEIKRDMVSMVKAQIKKKLKLTDRQLNKIPVVNDE